MSNRLALAVGKIILAWGRLDQQLHFLIRGMERALHEPHSTEGRFTERRKIFRRLCMRLALNNQDYESALDRALTDLVKLERKRGRIAHGFAASSGKGALFFNAPEAFAHLGTPEPETPLLEQLFTFEDLAGLELDIDLLGDRLVVIMEEAASIWRRERGSVLPQ